MKDGLKLKEVELTLNERWIEIERRRIEIE